MLELVEETTSFASLGATDVEAIVAGVRSHVPEEANLIRREEGLGRQLLRHRHCQRPATHPVRQRVHLPHARARVLNRKRVRIGNVSG